MSSSETSRTTHRGPIAWMVNNRVTPNLLMLFLIIGGLFMSTRIKQARKAVGDDGEGIAPALPTRPVGLPWPRTSS